MCVYIYVYTLYQHFNEYLLSTLFINLMQMFSFPLNNHGFYKGNTNTHCKYFIIFVNNLTFSLLSSWWAQCECFLFMYFLYMCCWLYCPVQRADVASLVLLAITWIHLVRCLLIGCRPRYPSFNFLDKLVFRWSSGLSSWNYASAKKPLS